PTASRPPRVTALPHRRITPLRVRSVTLPRPGPSRPGPARPGPAQPGPAPPELLWPSRGDGAAAAAGDAPRYSAEARGVLDTWRRSHGKRSPPRLTPPGPAPGERGGRAGRGATGGGGPRVGRAEGPEFVKGVRPAYTKRRARRRDGMEARVG